MAGSPVVRSPLPDVQIPDITIHELAFEKFRNFDERIALVSASFVLCSVGDHQNAIRALIWGSHDLHSMIPTFLTKENANQIPLFLRRLTESAEPRTLSRTCFACAGRSLQG